VPGCCSKFSFKNFLNKTHEHDSTRDAKMNQWAGILSFDILSCHFFFFDQDEDFPYFLNPVYTNLFCSSVSVWTRIGDSEKCTVARAG